MRTLFLILLTSATVFAFPDSSLAQWGMQQKKIPVTDKKITIDSLSVVESSVKVIFSDQTIENSFYIVDPVYSTLLFKADELKKAFPDIDSVTLFYRTIQLDPDKIYSHKKMPDQDDPMNYSVFNYKPSEIKSDFFYTEGLTKSGSISRGINFGNNQDLSVNSNLNLELSGKISDDVSILASVTDNNIPIQPDGNTQQLQDFDQVFIKVYNENNSLIAGDFWMKKPTGYFMNYNKRSQGASFSRLVKPVSKEKFQTTITGGIAVSKGKFARNIIQGVEGNQGPYRLRGAENEVFIIVLAGTEKIYIDGMLLERGQENDYIIDYNTAEITFTANRFITKDRRITAEFQYSDKNYARSVLFSSAEWANEKDKIFVNLYSEQDAKNQPLQQALTTNQKELMVSIGDSLDMAVSNSVTEVDFNTQMVLYKMIDSLGYDSVYVFSVHPDSARYKISFSYVGENNGDYVQSEFTALGKTFKWIAPDTVGLSIVHKGNYDPVAILTTPKQRQMATAGWEHSFSKKSKIGMEAVYTKYDRNLFSPLHNSDDDGYGGKILFENNFCLQKKNDPLTLKTKLQAEIISSGFEQIERFRSVEFERNWNILNTKINGEQYIGEGQLELSQKKWGRTDYSFNSFISGNDYSGFMHKSNSNIRYKKFNAILSESMLSTRGIHYSDFIRHKSTVSQGIKKINFVFTDEFERNQYYVTSKDSLRSNSYQFYDWETKIGMTDSSGNNWNLFYRERYDWKAKNNLLSKYAVAKHYGGGIELMKNPKNKLRIKSAYRELEITDSVLTAQKPDKTILGRIEYDLKALKNTIISNTFYETGTGQELKKEFIYIEVPAGQGVYTWIDYNENGIKELQEFEMAAFPDQATYIRSFVPTNEYVNTYSTQFSQSLNLNPTQILSKKKGFLKFLGKFSNQTAYRIDRKSVDARGIEAYNPFLKNIADTNLQSLGTSLRNSFFFNRTAPVFGADYTFQDSRNKILLSNGFDSRENIYHQVNLRWNITKTWLLQTKSDFGSKVNNSDFLTGRNYKIDYFIFSQKFGYQPGANMRISLKYDYSDKKNIPEMGGEQAFISDLGAEMKYNTTEKGSIMAQFNFIQIKYNGNTNSPLAFEMLNSLKPGNNFTWSLLVQRTINKNMQVNLNYNGRKTEENKIIHTGGVQVRAFF